MYQVKAMQMLKEHEGLRLKPYRCAGGRLTIGYGRNIEDCGIVEQEADFLLAGDLMNVDQELHEIFKNFDEFTDNRRAALIDMMFNLGKPRFMLFRKMIKAIDKNDWLDAAGEALDSLWAKQVGNRANEIAVMMIRG